MPHHSCTTIMPGRFSFIASSYARTPLYVVSPSLYVTSFTTTAACAVPNARPKNARAISFSMGSPEGFSRETDTSLLPPREEVPERLDVRVAHPVEHLSHRRVGSGALPVAAEDHRAHEVILALA